MTGALDDLTVAADLLDRWGLIPESYQYRNFYLMPTLMGQGLGYLLTRAPGPTASRLQSARKSFPKDDIFYREYVFAKCWEQVTPGVRHHAYGRRVGAAPGTAQEGIRLEVNKEATLGEHTDTFGGTFLLSCLQSYATSSDRLKQCDLGS